MVQHRRRQVDPHGHFRVGQRPHVAAGGGLRATEGGHGEGVRADLVVACAGCVFESGGWLWLECSAKRASRGTFYGETKERQFNGERCRNGLCTTFAVVAVSILEAKLMRAGKTAHKRRETFLTQPQTSCGNRLLERPNEKGPMVLCGSVLH